MHRCGISRHEMQASLRRMVRLCYAQAVGVPTPSTRSTCRWQSRPRRPPRLRPPASPAAAHSVACLTTPPWTTLGLSSPPSPSRAWAQVRTPPLTDAWCQALDCHAPALAATSTPSPLPSKLASPDTRLPREPLCHHADQPLHQGYSEPLWAGHMRDGTKRKGPQQLELGCKLGCLGQLENVAERAIPSQNLLNSSPLCATQGMAPVWAQNLLNTGAVTG